MKASDYIADFIFKLGVKHVFTVSGAGDLHILDSIHRHPDLNYICNHHEQACTMGAFSYARVTRNIGAALVTTGPGGTNAITGVCDAWVDSVPCLIISGQVKFKDTTRGKRLPLRQLGVQEINIIDIVRPFTKYAEMVANAADLRFHLEKAAHLAMSGRPGPVWLDIPMDVQAAQIEPDLLKRFDSGSETAVPKASKEICRTIVELIGQAKRPVILSGFGIKAARGENEFRELINLLQIPTLITWNAIDLLGSDHPLYAGRPGTYGQRGANFVIQNCDLLINIGSRLSIPQIGYEYSEFARAAKKVYVDIDQQELLKFDSAPDVAVHSDAKEFIVSLREALKEFSSRPDWNSWRKYCRSLRDKYSTALPEYRQQSFGINSFTFVDMLSDLLKSDELIVPGASGTSFTCTHQALRVKNGQTVFTSNGFAEMGFDLPGAIGACIGSNRKRTILITGDGSIQMNLQELQTIRHHKLPIKIFFMNNSGYLTIRQTQDNLFKGGYSGSGPVSGVTFPDIQKLGRVYEINMFKAEKFSELESAIRATLDCDGPAICEIVMDPKQLLVPKLSFKQLPDGRLVSPPLEDLYPFLPREEFRANMIIPTIKDDF